MKKALAAGTILSVIGAVLVVAAFLAAIQASNSVDTNDAAAMQNFLTLLTNQIGPVFFAGVGLLGTGLVILAVKLWLWTSRIPTESKEESSA